MSRRGPRRFGPRHQHRWSEWEHAGLLDATLRRRCEKCGRIATRKPRAKADHAHKYGPWEPGLAREGMVERRTCTVCGITRQRWPKPDAAKIRPTGDDRRPLGEQPAPSPDAAAREARYWASRRQRPG